MRRRTFTFPLWACKRLVRTAITQSSGSLARSSATAAMLVPVGASTMVQDLHGEGPAEFHRRVRYAAHHGMSLSFHSCFQIAFVFNIETIFFKERTIFFLGFIVRIFGIIEMLKLMLENFLVS